MTIRTPDSSGESNVRHVIIWTTAMTILQLSTAAQVFVRITVLAAMIAMAASCERRNSFEGLRVDSEFAVPDGQKLAQLSYLTVDRIAETIAKLLLDEPVQGTALAGRSSDSVAVYIALRSGGHKLADAWAAEGTLLQSLEVAVAGARKRNSTQAVIDSVELVLAHSFRPFSPDRNTVPISNGKRGITGLELGYRNGLYVLSPTLMTAENKSFADYIDELAKWWGLAGDEIYQKVRFRTFDAQQYLISIGTPVQVERMFRGNLLVNHDDVDRESVAAMADRLSDWVVRNVHTDGRMTYLYRPGRGEVQGRNNMVRQWMASASLMQIAHQRGDANVTKIAYNNIRYNLDKFYRVENNLGFIEYAKKAKLGALAIATMAVMRAPSRNDFAAEEAAMKRTIDYLWSDDGSFRTFYKPAERNDVQNFYPGEALLAWALMYEESRDATLLQKIMKSYNYYRDWHLKERNPAFVPWHTQAYFIVWQDTHDDSLADWVFEMNDWLLGVQQELGGLYPDTDGRFYDPSRPFGPPHASSTAVYLEGLIDAFALARELDDQERAERYRTAIVRGLRSLMQLEFADHVDMYYSTEIDRVRGGMRTTVYDNQIRVDNVQHTLMALRKILATFSEHDFSL